MRNKSILILSAGLVCAAFCLAGCHKPAQSEAISSNSKFKVEFLFENEGVKVYRFYDGGQYIYYTDARGMARWTVGKGKEIKVETVR